MTRFEKHSPLKPVCAILVKYKDGTEKRFEFGSHGEKGQAMMHLLSDKVLDIEEVPVDNNWKSVGQVSHDIITKLGDLCSTTRK